MGKPLRDPGLLHIPFPSCFLVRSAQASPDNVSKQGPERQGAHGQGSNRQGPERWVHANKARTEAFRQHTFPFHRPFPCTCALFPFFLLFHFPCPGPMLGLLFSFPFSQTYLASIGRRYSSSLSYGRTVHCTLGPVTSCTAFRGLRWGHP
jgi:hypothetical protein